MPVSTTMPQFFSFYFNLTPDHVCHALGPCFDAKPGPTCHLFPEPKVSGRMGRGRIKDMGKAEVAEEKCICLYSYCLQIN